MDQIHFVKSYKLLKRSRIKIFQKEVTLALKNSMVVIYFPTK